MSGYYSDHLCAARLQRCYDVAPPRVRQYLEAEIRYAAEHIRPADSVLELGCGYGRILAALADTAHVRTGEAHLLAGKARPLTAKARPLVGVDTSPPSLKLGRALLRSAPHVNAPQMSAPSSSASRIYLLQMNALMLAFRDRVFDVVLCLQNGISAFKVDQRALLAEAVRVTRTGGRVLFSSYAAVFWPHRLEWFERQAAAGLLGEIDRAATRDGVIVCKDGFRATTVSPAEFAALASGLPVREVRIEEVDESSVFCTLLV